MNEKVIVDGSIAIDTSMLLDMDLGKASFDEKDIELGEGEQFVEKLSKSVSEKRIRLMNTYQKDMLKRLGVSYKSGLSFQEAKALIKENILTRRQKEVLSGYMPINNDISRKKADIYINYFFDEIKNSNRKKKVPVFITDFLYSEGVIKKNETVTVAKWRDLSKQVPAMDSEVYRARRYGYKLPEGCTHFDARRIYVEFFQKTMDFLLADVSVPIADSISFADVLGWMEAGDEDDYIGLDRQNALRYLLDIFVHDEIYVETMEYIMDNIHLQRQIIEEAVSIGHDIDSNDFEKTVIKLVHDDIVKSKFFRIYMGIYQKYIYEQENYTITNDIIDYCCQYFPQKAESSDEWHDEFETKLVEFLKEQRYWAKAKFERILQKENVDIKDFRLEQIVLKMIEILPWATFTSKAEVETCMRNYMDLVSEVFSS